MDAELKNLRIDRTRRRSAESSGGAKRWIVPAVILLLLFGGWRVASDRMNAATLVEVQRVRAISASA